MTISVFMRSLVLLICVLFSYFPKAQDKTVELLKAPEDWRKEQLQLPLSFAPELDYEGIEDVRFAKGWSDKASEEFWTYTFVWYLDEYTTQKSSEYETSLALYFDGLLKRISKGKNIREKFIPTQAKIHYSEEDSTFLGQVTIFDAFFTEKTITLYLKINEDYCKTKKKHLVYFRFSPHNYSHQLWNTMQGINVPCD